MTRLRQLEMVWAAKSAVAARQRQVAATAAAAQALAARKRR